MTVATGLEAGEGHDGVRRCLPVARGPMRDGDTTTRADDEPEGPKYEAGRKDSRLASEQGRSVPGTPPNEEPFAECFREPRIILATPTLDTPRSTDIDPPENFCTSAVRDATYARWTTDID